LRRIADNRRAAHPYFANHALVSFQKPGQRDDQLVGERRKQEIGSQRS